MTPQDYARQEVLAMNKALDYIRSLSAEQLQSRSEAAQYGSFLRPNLDMRKLRELDSLDPIELRLARNYMKYKVNGNMCKASVELNKLIEVFK